MVMFLTAALAGSMLSKGEQKAYKKAVYEAYPGEVWAKKDLPVISGQAMIAAYISPIAEVRPEGIKIEVTTTVTAHYGGARSTWFGVRPYDTLTLKEVTFDDDFAIVTFIGTKGSRGRDTKIKVFSGTFDEVKQQMDVLVSTTDPVDDAWPDEIKGAIRNRAVVNGMNKRQAYLVVGEPQNANVTQDGDKKVETWTPRANDGMRIGYGASIKPSGFPNTLRFENGKLTGVATTSTGGVNLDD